jgi:hypothetical protein
MPSCFINGNPNYNGASRSLCGDQWDHQKGNTIDTARAKKQAALAAQYAQQQQAPVDQPQQQSSFFSYLNPLNAVQGVSNALTTANNGLRVGVDAIGQGVGQGVGAIGQGVGAIGQGVGRGVYNGTTALTDATGMTNHRLTDILSKVRDSLYSKCGQLPEPWEGEKLENYDNCMKIQRSIKDKVCPLVPSSALDERVCDDRVCVTADEACNRSFAPRAVAPRAVAPRAVAPRAVAPTTTIRGYGGKRTRRNKKSKKSATKKHKRSRSKKSNKKRSTKKKNN